MSLVSVYSLIFTVYWSLSASLQSTVYHAVMMLWVKDFWADQPPPSFILAIKLVIVTISGIKGVR